MKDYDNFFLPSNNLKKGKEFYQTSLGLPVKFDFSDMGMIAFKVGDNEPSIILKDVTKFPEAKPTIWFVVDSVTEEYKRLRLKGLNFYLNHLRFKREWQLSLKTPTATG